MIDATGVRAIKQFSKKCVMKGILFLIADVDKEQLKFLQDSGIEKAIGKEKIFKTVDSALAFAG